MLTISFLEFIDQARLSPFNINDQRANFRVRLTPDGEATLEVRL